MLQEEFKLTEEILGAQGVGVLSKAASFCEQTSKSAKNSIQKFLDNHGFDSSNICIVAVGSIGRKEALEASDLDVIPIAADNETYQKFRSLDKDFRDHLRQDINLKVSEGQDLTKCTYKNELTNTEAIGSDDDGSSELTRRILILSESYHIGGDLPLRDIRRELLEAYSEAETTRGRHVLSLCNDLARYYRTLCVEYKAKIDVHNKDWCTRNLKLRHSRKFWYFSTVVSIVDAAIQVPGGQEPFVEKVLDYLDKPPIERLFCATPVQNRLSLRSMYEVYAYFLDYMSCQDRRSELVNVTHENRYEISEKNAFPLLKKNSDLLHFEMIRYVEGLDSNRRYKLFDWFLF